MVDTELSVSVTADTDDAVDAIQDVTEAVEELHRALERLENTNISISIGGSGGGENIIVDSALSDIVRAEINSYEREHRRELDRSQNGVR